MSFLVEHGIAAPRAGHPRFYSSKGRPVAFEEDSALAFDGVRVDLAKAPPEDVANAITEADYRAALRASRVEP